MKKEKIVSLDQYKNGRGRGEEGKGQAGSRIQMIESWVSIEE